MNQSALTANDLSYLLALCSASRRYWERRLGHAGWGDAIQRRERITGVIASIDDVMGRLRDDLSRFAPTATPTSTPEAQHFDGSVA